MFGFSAVVHSEAILNQYSTEGNTYAQVMSESGMNLTVQGFLSYMGIRTIANTKNAVYVGMNSPAKSSYVIP